MQRERMWSVGVGAALLAIVAYSTWQRWQALAVSPYPLGVDGYFYPVQLRSLLETHALRYPASPLTFYFMLPLAALTDPITGAKLGAALGGALIALPAYAVGARLGRGRGPGMIAAVVATTSAGSAYLTIEFVKQGIGFTVGLAALWLVLRALELPTRPRIGTALAGIFATLLAHKLAAGLVIAIAIPATIEEARGRGTLRGRRLLYLAIGGTVLALVVLALGVAMPQRFLSASDLALLGDLVTSEANWSAPALATEQLTLTFEGEAQLGALVALGAAVALHFHKPKPRRPGERVAAWSFVGLALVIGLPWLAVDDPQGLGFRLRTAAFVPLALCWSIALGPLATTIEQRWREPIFAMVLVALLFDTPRERTEGRVLAHPALVAAALAATRLVPPGKTVIVPERHILFMVAWYTRANVSLRPEPIPYADRVRMMPLSFIGMGSPLDEALDAARRTPGVEPPLGLHPRHRNGLVLVGEPTWDWLLARLPPEAQLHWGAWPTI